MQIFSDKIFENPTAVLEARNRREFAEMFAKIDALKREKYILGYVEYEAWKIFAEQSPTPDAPNDASTNAPLAYFEVFDGFRSYEPSARSGNFEAALSPDLPRRDYDAAIAEIKNRIAAGDTYEVNFAYPNTLFTDCADDFELFERLAARQPTPFRAFLKNEHLTALSFSPELFFKIECGKISVSPMKGTVPRGDTPEADERNAEFLKTDEKNLAENLMIVDLMRNDLSRVSVAGSVEVESMFDVRALPTVHQMTSTISAKLAPNAGTFDIFESIFPCGSITGAPKLSTMRIIERLEKSSRGVYCGAICLFSPERTVCSVPIRTLERRAGEARFKYRVGGAIVWDSTADGERAESAAKSEFINGRFGLLETMRVENGVPHNFELHARRLENSARELGFAFDADAFRGIVPERDGIMRVELSRGGKLSVSYRKLSECASDKIAVSDVRVDSGNSLLRHKTTKRAAFDSAAKKAAAENLYDALILNERGEITEGSRTNIVVEKDGKLLTPPLSCGVLDGVMRRAMSEKLAEKPLFPSDLENADKIFCINSVRGIKRVYLA